MATLLLIDDSASFRGETRKVLERAGLFHQILEAEDGLAGLRVLLAESVDLVLCDLEMPGLDGEKLLQARGMSPGGAAVPFVFLTANTDPERRARLLRGGASDAIAKPFHDSDLVARLELHLRVARLQSELREKNAVLERVSVTDSLTGLRTRRFISEVLSIEVLRATRYRTPLTVLMADLDRFKRINDEYGHPAGDVVLAGIGRLLLETLRATDAAGRYGGEELLVILTQTELSGGVVLAERLRERIEAQQFEGPDGSALRISVSIGAAALGPGVNSPQALIEVADRALYRAKESGRNRVVSATALDSKPERRTPGTDRRRR